MTRRNGTDSGRPSVRPSSSSSMRDHGGRKRQTARGRQRDGPRSSRVWPTNHARLQTPPHCPRTAQETTDQLPTNPLPTFRSIMWAHPPTPRARALPGRPVPPPPGLVLLTGPKLPFPVTIQTTNKQTNGLERPSAPSLSHQARSDGVKLPETSWHPRARE